MSKVFIYSISCPETGEVRYIGKTIDPVSRFRKHLTYKRNTLCAKWIKSIQSKGLLPVFSVLKECNEIDWQDVERYYIRRYRMLGANLTNMTEGGDGGATMTGKKLTQEQKNKISVANTGRPRPDLKEYNQLKSLSVDQYDLNGNFIANHLSIRQAAQSVNRDDRRIQFMCKDGKTPNGRKINHVGGYIFKYASACN